MEFWQREREKKRRREVDKRVQAHVRSDFSLKVDKRVQAHVRNDFSLSSLFSLSLLDDVSASSHTHPDLFAVCVCQSEL